ncbi:enoyl-CoA hydratase/isomerase family protein [Kibdelosporangium aridum]|uniref:enoyl-CoA hydratase/isomerase family protein n=1 Tax=Kibdelosporangium aridum TaxID=2030 RepID=UPI0035EC0F65
MIEVTDHNGVAILSLSHGPVNALDLEILTELPNVLAQVADARAVVLTGAGRCFSAGVDLKRIIDGGAGYARDFIPALSTAAFAWFTHPKPTVAAVNGHALAGGCVLAAAADVTLMSGGKIGLTELAAGVPFPTVPLEIMRHACAAVASLVLTAKTISPAEAVAIGLVEEAVAPRRADRCRARPSRETRHDSGRSVCAEQEAASATGGAPHRVLACARRSRCHRDLGCEVHTRLPGRVHGFARPQVGRTGRSGTRFPNPSRSPFR